MLPACSRRYAAPEHELRALSLKEYGVARAAAEALLVGVPVRADVVAQRIDQELAWAGNPIKTDMKTVLTLTEHLTPLAGRFSRFTELTPESRLAYLQTWRNSRFQLRRAAYQALKGFVYYFAYVDDATRSLTGFPGTWPERFKIPATPIDFGTVI